MTEGARNTGMAVAVVTAMLPYTQALRADAPKEELAALDTRATDDAFMLLRDASPAELVGVLVAAAGICALFAVELDSDDPAGRLRHIARWAAEADG